MAKFKNRHYHEQARRADYGSELRGISHTQLQRQRGLRGSTLGPANEGRRLSDAEREEIERKLREQGRL